MAEKTKNIVASIGVVVCFIALTWAYYAHNVESMIYNGFLLLANVGLRAISTEN